MLPKKGASVKTFLYALKYLYCPIIEKYAEEIILIGFSGIAIIHAFMHDTI